MHFKKILLGTLFAAAVTSSFAEQIGELKVIGTIIPAGCTPNFTGGGVIDYGKISAKSLSTEMLTPLQPNTLSFTIGCDEKVKMQYKITDNRKGTAPAEYPLTGSYKEYGLGKQAAASIGFYTITVDATTADGVAADSIYNTVNAGVDDVWSSGVQVSPAAGYYMSIAASGVLGPIAAKVFSGNVKVQPYIQPTNKLDLTNEAVLDGSATMEIFYL